MSTKVASLWIGAVVFNHTVSLEYLHMTQLYLHFVLKMFFPYIMNCYMDSEFYTFLTFVALVCGKSKFLSHTLNMRLFTYFLGYLIGRTRK